MTRQEPAHQGNAEKPVIDCSGSYQDTDASAVQSERPRHNQQTGLRQRKHLRLSSQQHVVLLVATLLVCRSESLLLDPIGEVSSHGEPGDASLLTRVKAVKETARAVGAAADRWTGKMKQSLHIKETKVCLPSFMLMLDSAAKAWTVLDLCPALTQLPQQLQACSTLSSGVRCAHSSCRQHWARQC